MPFNRRIYYAVSVTLGESPNLQNPWFPFFLESADSNTWCPSMLFEGWKGRYKRMCEANVLLELVMYSPLIRCCAVCHLLCSGFKGRQCPCQLCVIMLPSSDCRLYRPQGRLQRKKVNEFKRGERRKGRLVVEKCGCKPATVVGKIGNSLLWVSRLRARSERTGRNRIEREMRWRWLRKAQWPGRQGNRNLDPDSVNAQPQTFASSGLHNQSCHPAVRSLK